AISLGNISAALTEKSAALEQKDAALKGERHANEELVRTSYFRNIALAERQLAAGNVGSAEELLEECPEHLRGWEWHYLKRQRYDDPRTLQHPDTVTRVAFSHDGGLIATGCIDGTVQLRDARTGDLLHTLGPDKQAVAGGQIVRGLAFAPD